MLLEMNMSSPHNPWYTRSALNVRQYSLSNLAGFSVCSHFFPRANSNWDPIKIPENSVIHRSLLSKRTANRQNDLLYERTFFQVCIQASSLKFSLHVNYTENKAEMIFH